MTRIPRVWLWVGMFLVALVASYGTKAVAADTPAARTEKQIETILVHVDKYGVYAPNLIFYWDPGMSQQKIATLTGNAQRLRNKEVVISYTTVSDLSTDRRPIITDITAIKRETPESGSWPGRMVPKEEEKPASVPLKTEPPPENEAPAPLPPEREPQSDRRKPIPSPYASITRAEVASFVRACLDATQSKDLERSLACYGDRVDYYAKGTVNKDFLRRDKSYYFRNWDKIECAIDGEIVLIVIDEPDLKIAKFNSRFLVENTKNVVSGRAENIWKIQKIGSDLKIVDEKQRIIERDAR